MTHRAALTEGSVPRTLVRLTIPMSAGVFAIMVFNLTDTYFVSRLGTKSLAAMSFTFPVIMVVGSVAMGLGLGASSCISWAIGQGDQHRVKRLATDSIVLGVLIVAALAVVGLLTIDPLFRALGATEELLPLIRSYMRIWYACIAVVIIPMVGNNAIRATGDMFTPGLIMVISAVLNVILDPIFIFGLFGMPRLELVGAATATAISRFLSLAAALLILHFRCRLLEFSRPRLAEVLASWRSILHIGIPAAMTNLLMPLTSAVIMRIVAGYGKEAVAAIGAAGRVEHFSYIIPIALGSTLVPFIGQNWGAGLRGRARHAWVWSCFFGVFWGALSLGVFSIAGRPIVRLFSKDPRVVEIMVRYLRIVFLSFGLIHVCVHTGLALNALGKPLTAAGFNAVRLLGLTVPLAFVGSQLWGLAGVFAGIAVAVVVSGIIAIILGRRYLEATDESASLVLDEPVPEAVAD